MKFLHRKLLKTSKIFSKLIFYLQLIKNDTLLFFMYYKLSLTLFFNNLYFKKIATKYYYFFLFKKNNNIFNFSFYFLHKIFFNILFRLHKNYIILNFQGRGFRVLTSVHSNILVLKLGFSHNINFLINKKLQFSILSKNGQKLKITGSLCYLIQILACLNFIKKKNVFTNKGVFYSTEFIKIKKSTKTSW